MRRRLSRDAATSVSSGRVVSTPFSPPCRDAGVPPIAGPIARVGGRAGSQVLGISVYARDPDDNLIEFISYDAADLERFSTSAS